ncbi:restriction endonuclease subunit S [Lachnospiraceae bacterium CLA-AA-H183]
MREMKDSRLKWIGEIPSSWNVMPNKYLMKKKKVICPVYTGEDILSLTMKGVIVRDLDAGGKMPTSFDGYQRLEPGNLLMCLFDIDVTPRCIGLIKQAGLSSPAYSQFELNGMGNAEYYCYYYTMLDNDKTLLHLAKNLRHSLTEDQLGAISVIVPPVQEQKKIADFLDAKCSEIDALSADIQTQIDILEQYKRSVITEAVTKGLNPDVEMKDSGLKWIGKIPSSWNVMPNKYLMKKKKVICPVYKGEDILSLTMKGVIVRDLDAGGKMPTSFDGYQRLEPGNLLMCLFDIDVTPRCIGLIKKAGLSSPAYSQFELNDMGDADYYCYYYTMLDNDKTLLHLAKNLRHSLTEDQLGAISVIVPPVQEQKRIANFLDAKCEEIDKVIATKIEQLALIDKYKKSLIYEYVTGKKEVPAI